MSLIIPLRNGHLLSRQKEVLHMHIHNAKKTACLCVCVCVRIELSPMISPLSVYFSGCLSYHLPLSLETDISVSVSVSQDFSTLYILLEIAGRRDVEKIKKCACKLVFIMEMYLIR